MSQVSGKPAGEVVVALPECPSCGSNEIVRRRDAWEVRALNGFSEHGTAILDEDSEIELFDDIHFECERCGHKGSDEAEFEPDLSEEDD